MIKIYIIDCISFVLYVLLNILPARRKNVVLVYHSIGYVDPKSDKWRMNITPERFESHLKFICKCGCSVDITFDDGFKNNFTYAYPLLLKYGLDATFFITVDFVDGKLPSRAIWDIGQKIEPLEWYEIKKMSSSGIKFGSHSKTHRVISKLSGKDLEEEVATSRKRIEQMLNTTVDSFSYPIGSCGTFNSDTRAALFESGYSRAYTNIMGLNDDPPEDIFAMRRVRINTEDNIFRLKMKLMGAYNWIDVVASIFRR